MSELITDLNIVEILLLSVLSFIGAFCNRFWQFLNHGTPITLRTWMVIFVNVIVVTVISISLNSFIMEINPRMMLLPPFLMSLVGDELFVKLMHINSSIEFIDWLLMTLKVKSESHDQSVQSSDERQEKCNEKYQELVKECVSITTKMEDGLIQYKKSHDINIILTCYKEVVPEVSVIEIRYKVEFHSDPTIKDHISKMITLEKELEDLKDNYLYTSN